MNKLWIAFIVLATLGSIYPFDFQPVELDSLRIGTFLQTCCRLLGRGDILGNVLLFVPVGFTGVLARRPGTTTIRHLGFVFLVATFVALILQLLQIYLPSRDENLQDVAWNFLGIGCGATLASLIQVSRTPSDAVTTNAAIIPLALLGAWLTYRLIPFVPSFDFQLIKDSIRPVLRFQMSPVSIVHDVTAWSVVAYLLQRLQPGRPLDNCLPVVIVGVFCLEVLIVDNQIDFSNVAGAVLAVPLWWIVLRHIHLREGALLILLFVSLALSGLTPFDVRVQAVPFHWIPFRGFLGGSMYLNTQSAAEKVFLYGSLVYLLSRSTTKLITGIVVSFAFVLFIEIAQTILAGHTPEITDPLLLVCAAIAVLTLNGQEGIAGYTESVETSSRKGQSGSTAEFDVGAGGRAEAWVSETINLRHYQVVFLKRLSREMDLSASAVTRRIVAQRLPGPDQVTSSSSSSVANNDSIEIGQIRSTKELKGGGGRERWVKLSVNFRREQYRYLSGISAESGFSISKITRQIVEQFIDGLDGDDTSNGESI